MLLGGGAATEEGDRMNTDRPQSESARGKRPASSRAKAGISLGLVSIVGLCLAAAGCHSRHRDRKNAAESIPASSGGLPKKADDGAAIQQAWKEQDRSVRQHLDGYGWIDRAAGIAHIPIDRELALLVEEQKMAGPRTAQIEDDQAQRTDTSLQRAGRRLFGKYGCNVCHGQDAVVHAPSLAGIYGQKVRLSDGTFVRADDVYLRDMILYAGKRVVAGYAPVMPSYRSVIPKPDVRELIAYLKSFTDATSAPSAARSP